MNIFNKYGIKEVADVIFYSITRVGDEEFYTPVLFFDTLKVSTLNKSVETVNALGGKGNGKILSWNFNKEEKLQLQDALFSEASMNVYRNGQLQARLSDWTSAIAKLNVANKYGMLHYSVKAKPSPELTQEEWAIVFRCAEKARYNAKYGDFVDQAGNDNTHLFDYSFEDKLDKEQDLTTNSYVAENRKFLVEKYTKRIQPTPWSRDITHFFIFPKSFTDVNKNIHIEIDTESYDEKGKAQKYYDKQLNFIKIGVKMMYDNRTNHRNERWDLRISFDETDNERVQLIALDNENETIRVVCANRFFYTHVPFYIFPNYLSIALGENLCFCDMQDKMFLAMPQRVIEEIIKEIDSIRKIGHFTNDLYDSQYIDRFEQCFVSQRDGFEIDAEQQRRNIARYYQNDFSGNYTIYYDAKTMLPLFGSTNNNGDFNIQEHDDGAVKVVPKTCGRPTNEEIMQAIINDIRRTYGQTEDGVPNRELDKILSFSWVNNDYYVFYSLKNPNKFRLKHGTVYYKWTRTVDNSDNIFTAIGTDLIINNDTFSDEYRIVGETYIREQKTGKDQRYQFVIKRAKVSPSTNIELKADGNPTTFSMDVNVLMPKDKVMMELRQYNVEEDKLEGGFRIIPQSKKYSYTPTNQEYADSVIDNNEIY